MSFPLPQAAERRWELVIPPQCEGGRLDVVIPRLVEGELSRNQVQRLLKEGRITLEGRPARAATRVRAGQQVLVSLPPPEPDHLVPEPMDLVVLYEDAHLIAVDKPAGLVVHPAPGHATGTLVHGLLHHCGALSSVGGRQRPGIVHRLDKDTSGVLLAAKSDAAHRRLVAAFAAGRVDKEYLALVWGAPPEEGEIAAGIGRHPVDRKRMSTRGRHTKPAVSRWRVLQRFGGGRVSLLRVNIHTGRTHQIRVHMSEAGWPVLLDAVYGRRRRRGRLPAAVEEALAAAGRQMLHARRLSLEHPVEGRRLELSAPLPQDFQQVLQALEAWDRAG
jgi:23S rRNA pseudouridine1911/1915/1917 synthase